MPGCDRDLRLGAAGDLASIIGMVATLSPSRALRILLVLLGCSLSAAVIGMVLPFGWMDRFHRLAGLGELPRAPIVGYLARSASALYAMLGAVYLFAARDPLRYRSLVVLLGWLLLGFGVAVSAIEIHAGLPWWWIVGEGVATIGTGAVILILAARLPAAADGPAS